MRSPRAVLVVDDDVAMGEMVVSLLDDHGIDAECVGSADAALAAVERREFDAVLSDIRMPGRTGLELLGELRERCPDVPVVLMTAFGSIDSAVAAMRGGAFHYVTKPFKREEVLVVLERAFEHRELERENARLRRAVDRTASFGDLLGASPAMREIFAKIRKVADSRSSVLITGESGTGKEVVARTLHFSGSRREKPFIPINCTAIPEGLLESELFGHRKGAFTGADSNKEGLFARANGGTLFLDEIGDMGGGLQSKLLRVLQDGEVRPVGGTESVKVDVRIVAATNSELETAVARGTFREDLLYRLDVIRLDVPALRERPEDILFLFSHFARELSRQHVRELPELTDGFTSALLEHPWPGNVRELENFVERLLLTHRGKPLGKRDFNRLKRGAARPAPGGPSVGFDPDSTLADAVEDAERRYLRGALQHYRGRVQETADAIGVNRRTLLRKLKKHGLDRREFRDT